MCSSRTHLMLVSLLSHSLTHCESVDIKSEECLIEEQLVSSSSIVDSRHQEPVFLQQGDSPLANTKSNTISSSPSASSDSGHCSRASPDITSLTTTPNGMSNVIHCYNRL